MPELVALALPGGRRFVEELLATWDRGDAAMPVDPRLPPAARERLLSAMRPARVVDEHSEVRREDPLPTLDGDAVVVATSGSTGEPKGVVHTHDSISASAAATNTALGVGPTDRWLCALPVAHVAGLSVITRALDARIGVEVLPRFQADAVEAAARLRGATLTTLVPTALGRIDPGLFRRIVVGGAAPPAELPPNVVVSYGLTETGSAVAYDGRALTGAEIRVVDGEVQIRGPMLMRAYRNPALDGQDHDPRDPDGWFRTGDAGLIDDEGRLVVFGRRDEMINTGGEKVWPRTVERVLEAHPAVEEVAVVGRPDPEWGEVVVAFVVPRGAPPSLDELRGHVKEQLPAWSAPRRLALVQVLPRTVLGKVDLRRLGP